MKMFAVLLLAVGFTGLTGRADEVLFKDDFHGKIDAGWSWLREHREAWRTTRQGLEVRIEPGNLWGPSNNAKNVLVRPAPVTTNGPIVVSVTVSNQPSAQYEQVNLSWYYDDSHMVKLGQELVDGKLCVVMGREEKDRTRTIKILPLDKFRVTLRLTVNGNTIRGQFQPEDSPGWQTAGECELPAPTNAAPKISLQFYQGPADRDHWARVSEFQVRRLAAP